MSASHSVKQGDPAKQGDDWQAAPAVVRSTERLA